jgi:thiamine-phosphate pyrophosphorylase
MKTLYGLYVITDTTLLPSHSLYYKVEQAISGGAKLVQFRDKSLNREKRGLQVRELSRLCNHYAIPLIINDDIELAVASAADGVHLGKDDIPLEQARKRLGEEAIIGVSCYNDVQLAVQAEKLGADYVAFGSFFPSLTKTKRYVLAPSY